MGLPGLRYALPILTVVIAWIIQQLLDASPARPSGPFPLLIGAVIFSAWQGGRLGGFLAVLCAAALGTWGILTDADNSSGSVWDLALFLAEGGAVSLLAGARHQSEALADSRDDVAPTSAACADATSDLATARDALAMSQARFQRLFEANITGICVTDATGKVLQANQAFLDLIASPATELTAGNLNLHALTPPEYHDADARCAAALREGGGCPPYEKELRRHDGGRTPVLIGTVLYPHSQGDQALWLVSDLTAQKRTEKHVEKARQAAQDANQAKGEFLANISHELRTPLNAIIGMTALALDEAPAPPLSNYLSTVKESSEVLLRLMSDILDFSRIETGRIHLEPQDFRLHEVVGQTLDPFRARAAEKRLGLTSRISANCPEFLIGDAPRLRQILTNLVDNALKFTVRGSVHVLVEVDSAAADEVCLHFLVADTGIGISAADQSRIFSPFTQVDASTTRKFGGTGLGLAISQELSNLMGGRLWVESRLQHGSEFHLLARFVLQPAGQEPPAAQKPAAAASAPQEVLPAASAVPRDSGLRILVAEDTPANQRLVTTILKKRGHHVRVAQNGAEALEIFRREPFDLILMDVQMPVLDGFEATSAVRAQESTVRDRVPIVAMTAHAMRGDRERCLSAGMDAYVSKPIDVPKLIELIESLTHYGEPSATSRKTASSAQNRSREPRPDTRLRQT